MKSPTYCDSCIALLRVNCSHARRIDRATSYTYLVLKPLSQLVSSPNLPINLTEKKSVLMREDRCSKPLLSASPERDYEKESLFLCIRDSPTPKSKSPIVAQRQHFYDLRQGKKRRNSGSPTTLLKPTPTWRDLAHLWKHKLNQAKSIKPNHLTDHVHADRLFPVRAE